MLQFSGLLEFCDHAANLGIVVVVAALSGDFQRKVNLTFNFSPNKNCARFDWSEASAKDFHLCLSLELDGGR